MAVSTALKVKADSLNLANKQLINEPLTFKLEYVI